MQTGRGLPLVVTVSLFLLLMAGCSIYENLEEPPEAGGSDVEGGDVTNGDAVDDTVDDTADGTSSDTAADTDADGCVPVGDPNEAETYCSRANAECGDIAVVDDCGVEHNVTCGTCDTGARCSGGATNFPRTCVCDCVIEGECYSEGNTNPDNPCQVCDASNDSAWTDAADGTACDDGDELLCTGVCNSGTCDPDPRTGQCVVDGSCYNDGDTNPSNVCEICSPADDDNGWTWNDGVACDDGDALDCTGVCSLGSCDADIQDGFCVVGGECRTNGDANPSNECEYCDAQSDQEAWTVDEGNTCGGSPSCFCSTDAMCVKTNGRACGT